MYRKCSKINIQGTSNADGSCNTSLSIRAPYHYIIKIVVR